MPALVYQAPATCRAPGGTGTFLSQSPAQEPKAVPISQTRKLRLSKGGEVTQGRDLKSGSLDSSACPGLAEGPKKPSEPL